LLKQQYPEEELSTPSNLQDKKGLIQNLKSFFSQVFFPKEKLLVKVLKRF